MRGELKDFLILKNKAVVEAEHQRLNLEPRVLAHFNAWADKTINPLLLGEGLTLKPAKRAIYDQGRKGFEIMLGDITFGARLLPLPYFLKSKSL